MRAQDVPEARDSLVITCQSVRRQIVAEILDTDLYSVGTQTGAERLTEELNWLLNALDIVVLWFVSPDMTDLLSHAWQSLPATTLTHQLLPDEYGMVVFGHELQGIAADMDEPIPLDGYVWGPATLRRTHLNPEPPSEDAVSLAAVRHITVGDTVQGHVSNRDYWGPLGHTDWLWGTDIDDLTIEPDEDSELRRASMIEDRRMMAAFWLLATQPNIAETTDVVLPRPVRRRVERAGRPVPRVRLIDVRRPRRSGPPSGHREVDWSHQWIVGGHWRQQAYGPGHTLRRPQWIAPYRKGPEDKPLIVPETVKVWR